MYNREKTDVDENLMRLSKKRSLAILSSSHVKFVFIERIKETNSKISGALLSHFDAVFETERNK